MRSLNRRSALKAGGAAMVGIVSGTAGCISNVGGGGGESLKFGLLTPMSGKYSKFGQLWTEIQKVAIDEIVNEDPPLGNEVEVFVEDTQSKPDVGITAARNLVNNEGVQILSQGSSEALVTLQDFLRKNEVVFTAPVAGTTQISDRPGDWIFRFIAPDGMSGRAWAYYAHEIAGHETASTMFLNDPGGTAPAEAFAKRFRELGGEILAEVSVTPNRSSYRQKIGEAFDEDPDITALSATDESGSTILNQWFQQDIGGQWLLSNGLRTGETIRLVESEVFDSAVAMGGTGRGPGYETFAQVYEEHIGKEPGSFVRNAYDATIVPMLAAAHAGSVEGADIAESMRPVATPPGESVATYPNAIEPIRNGDDVDFEGAGSNCNFNEHGDVITEMGVFEVKDGKWEKTRTISPDTILE